MPHTLLFLADPLAGLDPEHDTTIALIEAAQRRGQQVHFAEPRQLGFAAGRPVVTSRPLGAGLAIGAAVTGPVSAYDALFIRMDPPVTEDYLRATHLLDLVDERSTVMVNSPRGLQRANEKLIALRFPSLCPPTLISADAGEITAAVRTWKQAVLKPTSAMGGRGVFRLTDGDPNLGSLVETGTDFGRKQVVIQRFLPEVVHGDKRVIVLDGEPVGAVRRRARDDDFRCNLRVGAVAVPEPVDDRDRAICAQLAATFADLGLFLVGLDIIGDRLIEINVTSPTGVRDIDAAPGAHLADQIVAAVEARCSAIAAHR